jgi:hypothetical protein
MIKSINKQKNGSKEVWKLKSKEQKKCLYCISTVETYLRYSIFTNCSDSNAMISR